MPIADTPLPLKLSLEPRTGPYLRVLVSQLDAIEAKLKEHDIFYWVSENHISIDNGPYVTVINFGRGGDPDRIQPVLDSVH